MCLNRTLSIVFLLEVERRILLFFQREIPRRRTKVLNDDRTKQNRGILDVMPPHGGVRRLQTVVDLLLFAGVVTLGV